MQAILVVVAVVVGAVLNFQPAEAEVGSTRTDATRPELADAVSAGGNHACAILSDGSLWCWGRNSLGQLGLGDTTNRSTPARVGSATNWRSVAAGGSTTCAVNELDELWCWGANVYGQLGLGDTSDRSSPTKVTALGTSVESVAVGNTTTCVVTTAGGLQCAGGNSSGQLGNGTTTSRSSFGQVTGLAAGIASVGVGFDFACARRDNGTVVCWGSDLWGYRGDGTAQTPSTDDPSTVPGINSAAALSVGEYSVCVILATKGVRCWGANHEREIKNDATQYFVSPTTPSYHGNTEAIAVGNDHICSIATGFLSVSLGDVVCGGRDDRGQLSRKPTSGRFLAITPGELFTCAIDSDQELYCWGANPYGELGNGNTTSYPNYADGPSRVDFGALDTVGEPEPPSAPQSLVAFPSAAEIVLGWDAPETAGTAAIDDYEYRIDDGGGFGAWTSLGSTDRYVRLTGLTNAQSHVIEVRASSAVGEGAAASVTATPVEPCDPYTDCAVGDVGPGGGVIFYDRGTTAAWGRFIEAAPAGWAGSIDDPSVQWGCSGTSVATSYNYGDGESNTAAIVTACPTSAAATISALSLTVDGEVFDDWLMPSSYELNMLIDRSDVVPGLDPAGDPAYWSSRTYGTASAYVGGNTTESRNNLNRIRPVRYLDGPVAPSAPQTVTARAGQGAVTVDWEAPATSGTAAVSDIEYRLSTNDGSTFGAWTSLGTTSGSATISGLSNGTDYLVQLRAISGHGSSSGAPIIGDAASMSVATATPSDVCDPIADCDLGDVGPGGGIIVYDAGAGGAPGRYLEAAPPGWSGTSIDPVASWGCSGTDIVAAAGSEIGDGAANSVAIDVECGSSAAGLATGLSTTVDSVLIDDWYLPSAAELAALSGESNSLGGWRSGSYWSSTNIDAATAVSSTGNLAKATSAAVRPVRMLDGPTVAPSPTLGTVTTGDGTITLTWSDPSTAGTAPLTDYEIRRSDDGGVTWSAWASIGLVNTYTVTGLVNGVGYDVEIRAVNRGGDGVAVASATQVPTAVPSSPRSLSATAGDYRITIEWASPTSLGGLALLDYEWRASTDSGGSWTAWTSSGVATTATMTGLDPSAEYIFEVRAVNSLGPSASASTAGAGLSPASTTTTTATTTTTSTVPASQTSVPAQPSVSTTAPANSVDGGTSNSSIPQTTQGTSQSPELTVDERAPAGPGRGRIIVDGNLIEVEVIRVPSELADSSPAGRSQDDIAAIRQIGEQMLEAVTAAAGEGFASPVSIRYTASGAVFIGLLVDPVSGAVIEVPVEEVSVLVGGGLVLMVGGLSADGSTDVVFDGVLRLGTGGWLAVLATGLEPSANGSVIVMSTPRQLASFVLDASGSVAAQVQIPSDLPVGNHTAVVAVAGDSASIGFTVIPSTLPVTGSRGLLQPFAVLFAAVGALLAILVRSRRLGGVVLAS